MNRRRAAIASAALVAMLLTSACESLRPPDEPVTHERQVAPLQAATTPSGDVPWPDAYWWRGYGDDNLNSLIETALRDSPDLAVATARFGAATEDARVAGAQAGLKVDANGAYERYRLSDNGVLPPEFLGFNWVNQADLGISASYTFDWWGRNRALIESATDHARASEAEQQVVVLALASSVAQTYFGWQADGARIALLAQRLDTLPTGCTRRAAPRGSGSRLRGRGRTQSSRAGRRARTAGTVAGRAAASSRRTGRAAGRVPGPAFATAAVARTAGSVARACPRTPAST